MIQRTDLEQPSTLEQMRSILLTFEQDREAYPVHVVRRRTGLVKDIVEEYYPLTLLVESLPSASTAFLATKFYEGPDACVILSDGSERSVQITCAGESYITALQREALNQGRAVFPNCNISRERTTLDIIESGRLLTTREGNTKKAINEIVDAIGKKMVDFHTNTNILLVTFGRSEIGLAGNWKKELSSTVSNFEHIPFQSIYVATLYEAHCCWFSG